MYKSGAHADVAVGVPTVDAAPRSVMSQLAHVVILTITACFFYSLVIIVISYSIKIYMLTKSKIIFGHYDNKNNKHSHWIGY